MFRGKSCKAPQRLGLGFGSGIMTPYLLVYCCVSHVLEGRTPAVNRTGKNSPLKGRNLDVGNKKYEDHACAYRYTRHREQVQYTEDAPTASVAMLEPHGFSDAGVNTRNCRDAVLIGCPFPDPRGRELICRRPVAGAMGVPVRPHQYAVLGVQGLSFGFGWHSGHSTLGVERANRSILSLVLRSPDRADGETWETAWMSCGSSYTSVVTAGGPPRHRPAYD